MPTKNHLLYNWKIGGEAGYGIMNTGGPIFAKTFIRAGLSAKASAKAGFFVFIYSEYPSLIRGGHNTMQVAVSEREVGAAYSQLDQLVALNGHTIVAHQNEVKPGGVVVYDAAVVKLEIGKLGNWEIDNSHIPPLTGTHTVDAAKTEVKLRQDIKFIPINMTKIAQEIGGDKIMKNVAAVGVGLQITNYKLQITKLLEIAKGVLEDVFRKKGSRTVKANQKVLEAGYESVIGNL